MEYRILIVDDDIDFANRLSEALYAENRYFFISRNAKKAKQILNNNKIHLVLLDERLPDDSGTSFLEQIKKYWPDLITIFITATNEIPVAVNAIRLGAYHYIVKPFKIQELENTVKNALEKIALTKKINDLEKREFKFDKPIFLGTSPKIAEIKKQIQDLKNHPFTSILISGETGTGKGSLAKYIHWQYNGKMNDFVHISCADIPPNLLETELFGYEKGAFTDAKSDKQGLFEIANNGTLFLDEIDSFPLELQKKLLYFLDNKKIRRVGGTKEISVEIRLIVATNANLAELVNKGEFRKDLYYRLNVFHIDMPPLRERHDEIELFSNYFKDLFNLTFNKNVNGFSQKAMKKLRDYIWPGNIRELKNVIERAMLFCKDKEINDKNIYLAGDEIDTGIDFVFPSSRENLIELDKLEVKYIKHALKLMDENRTHTAKKLGISIPTLLSKIKK